MRLRRPPLLTYCPILRVQFVQAARKNADVFKKKKHRQTEARHKEAAKHSMTAAVAGKVERAQRREQSLATKRFAQQQTQEYAAQVRFETRPLVRQESREYFQAQRDAIVAKEKQLSNAHALKIQAQKAAYLRKQEAMKAKVDQMHKIARQSRDELYDKRWCEAESLRQQLAIEQQRKEQSDNQALIQTRQKRDEIYTWAKLGTIGP